MLKLQEITKDYKTGSYTVHALRGVNLSFRANEFVSILGPSGCGKTTLLNIIGGLDHYTSGDLVIRGVSTKEYKDRDWDVYRNHRIGFVFQSYNLIPHQTVLGNVELALTIAGLNKAERQEKAKKALERVGLANELYKKPNQLSGGQMQRVAIARALVNDPEILLADEPTGALDSKTSVQIMELIREIAGERLVIMVTHNPELAEKYSTRIVRLEDGLVVSDSNPYESETAVQEKRKTQAWTKKTGEKASMSFRTALGLSGRNLLAKKGRTAITSFAGSIGIVSVSLVLALSNGFNGYIRQIEEDMLSYYPLQVKESSVDINSIMANMTSPSDMPDLSKLGDKVYVNSFLTKIAKGMMVTNDISPEYIAYVENMDESLYGAIHYNYDVNLTDNLFTNVVTGGVRDLPERTETMSLSALKKFYTDELSQNAGQQYAQMGHLVEYLGDVVNVMPGTKDFSDDRFSDYVLSQYDVFGEFPKQSNEAVIVVGGNNDMTDLLLAQLGFLDEATFLGLYMEDEIAEITIPFETMREKEYTLYFNDEVYVPSDDPMDKHPFRYQGNREDGDLSVDGENGVQIKVSAILRLKDGYTYGCLSSGLNLTEKLVEEYLEKNMQSEIVKWMSEPRDANDPNSLPQSAVQIPVNGAFMTVYRSPVAQLDTLFYAENSGFYVNITQSSALRYIGGNDRPSGIDFYPLDFEAKEKMLDYLDTWNVMHEGDKAKQITYNDTVGIMMGMVKSILDAITYVLVAFTAISLVVSSVMIGIITYVSVVERTKEIGVLRSLGARKKDIKNLFNAETFIIGLSAGVIGVASTYLISFGINALLGPLTGIKAIASLPFTSALIMTAISVVLTLISGLIPARSAARKDPVIALRTE